MTEIIASRTAEVVEADNRSYVDWGAILGGAFVAAALSTIMTSFGAAIGLSLTSPLPGKGVSVTVMAVTTGLWVLWVGVSSFAAGGYLAGRLRRRAHDASEHESNVRDGAHGAIVWALGTVLLALMLASTAAGVTKTVVEAASNTAGGALATLADKAADPLTMATDRLLRGTTAANPAQAEDPRAELGRILARSAASGTIAPEDKSYVASIIASRTGISQADAEKRIDDTVTQVKAAADEARVAAEKARKYGILIAFLTAAGLLVSGAAAWGAATVGGNHRDEETELRFFGRW
jgi:amino acid transporter